MGSFGEHLRRQREMRGISLEEIVATTKISRRLLQALEDEQFDLLPGGIFNKSYVKAYAKCVGIREDEAVAEYLEASQEAPPDTRVIAQQHASIHSDRRPQRPHFPFMPVLILVAAAAGGVGAWKTYQNHKRERATQMAAAPTVATTPNSVVPGVGNGTQAVEPARQADVGHEPPVAAPVQTASAAPGASANSLPANRTPASGQTGNSVVSAGSPFEVTIRPKDRAWVSIKSDGQYVVRGIIRPPDVKTIRATDQVVFYTGNAGAVEVDFDGKNVPLTGGANQEAVLVFNSHGLQPKAAAQ